MYQSLPASASNTGSWALLMPGMFTLSQPVLTLEPEATGCVTGTPESSAAEPTGAAIWQPSRIVLPFWSGCCHAQVIGTETTSSLFVIGLCTVPGTAIGFTRS